MLPKRTEAELDAFVEMTRNEADPSPAPLSAETLGEEDRLRLSFLRNAGISKVTEIKRALQVEPDEQVQASLNEMLGYHQKSIAWADRLLNQREGE